MVRKSVRKHARKHIRRSQKKRYKRSLNRLYGGAFTPTRSQRWIPNITFDSAQRAVSQRERQQLYQVVRDKSTTKIRDGPSDTANVVDKLYNRDPLKTHYILTDTRRAALQDDKVFYPVTVVETEDVAKGHNLIKVFNKEKWIKANDIGTVAVSKDDFMDEVCQGPLMLKGCEWWSSVSG